MHPDSSSKRARMDPDFDLGELLDTSAARFKMAVRPKRRHADSRQSRVEITELSSTIGDGEERWIVKQRVTGGKGFVPSNILKKRLVDDGSDDGTCDDPRRMRDAVVRELIETEQELGRDLNFVLEKYMRAIDAGGTKVPQCVRENKDLIFSNFRKIAEFHNTVLIEGVKYYAKEPKMLGKTFLRLERDFDQHVNYCRDEPAAQEFLAENDEAREYFAELSHQIGDDKSLSEHLKLPIQRINDYQLLLKELAKYSVILKENPTDLYRALEFMLAVPTRASDSKFISSIEGYRGNIHKLGRLLRHDWFTVTDAQGRSKERYLFLFKARILITKVKRISEDRSVFILKHIVKLPEVEVKDLPDDPLSYQLIHTKPEDHPRYPLTLKAHSAQAKPNWLKDIADYIADQIALAEHAADDLQVIDQDAEDKSHKSSASESSKSKPAPKPKPEPEEEEEEEEEESEEELPAKPVPAPPKPAEQPKPEPPKPVEQPKPEPPKPVEQPKPEPPKPVEVAKPVEAPKPSPAPEPPKPPAPKPAEPAPKPAEPAPAPKPEPSPKPVETPKPEPPKPVEEPKPEPPKPVEQPKPEPQKVVEEPKKVEAPIPEPPKTVEAPKPEPPKAVEEPKPVEVPQPEPPKPVEVPKQETPKPVEEPKPEPPKPVEAPKPERKKPVVEAPQPTPEPVVSVPEPKMSETIVESISISESVKESVTVTTSSTSAGVSERQSLRLNMSSTEATTITTMEGSVPATPTSPPPTPIREPNRPRFSTTIEPLCCEPGETASFTCKIQPSDDPSSLTWLKDNKPLEDKLADRVTITSEEDNTVFRLTMLHTRESDSGTYTARVSNPGGSSTCSTYLIVQEMTPEEKERRAKERGGQFLVKLKDTEILEETYLRFMIKVKGDPTPVIKFFKDGELITETNERIKIVTEKAEMGFYELVVPHVTKADGGKYKCTVMNKYGSEECEATVKVVAEKDVFSGLRETLNPSDNPDFKWMRDGKPFDPEERFKVLFKDDEDSLALLFQHVKPEDAGLYTCVASTTSGKISCSAELTVQGSVKQLQKEPEKPSILAESKSSEANVGGSAMLELKVKGYPKPDVKWLHDGKEINAGGRFRFLYEDDESMALVIKGVEAGDGGKYRIVAKNELGESALEIELLVKAPPKFRTKMEDRKAMTEETITIEAEIDGSPKPEIKWFKDGKQLSTGDRVKITSEGNKYRLIIEKAKLDDSGSFSVVASNDISQCTEYFKMTVNAPPTFLKTPPKSMEGRETDTVTLDVKVTCSPPPKISWWVCRPSQGTQIKEYKMEEGKEELKVDGKHIIMTQDGDNYSLKISGLTRADSGFYRCIAANEFGQSTADCEVNVRCAPQLTSKLENMTVKEGETNISLNVGVSAYPDPKVRWFLNDVEIDEKRTEFQKSSYYGVWKMNIKEITSELAGKYTCKISNDHGEVESSATYTVLNKPRFTKSLKGDMEVDEGQNLDLNVSVFAVPAATVKWYKNGNEVSADARIKITKETSESYNMSVTIVKGQDAGEYEARATNEQGTTSTVCKVKINKKVSKLETKEEIVEEKINKDENNAKQTKKDAIKRKSSKAKLLETGNAENDAVGDKPQADVTALEEPKAAVILDTGSATEIAVDNAKLPSVDDVDASLKPKLLDTGESAEGSVDGKLPTITPVEDSKTAKSLEPGSETNISMDAMKSEKSDAESAKTADIIDKETAAEVFVEPHKPEVNDANQRKAAEVLEPATAEGKDGEAKQIEVNNVEDKAKKGKLLETVEAEEVSGKPRASRSLSTGSATKKTKKDEARKFSIDVASTHSVDEAQHEKVTRAESPQHGKRQFQENDSGDDDVDALLQRVQKQRSVLEEIMEQEDARAKDAVPTIISHNMEAKTIYESLETEYEVHAEGIPRPEAMCLGIAYEVHVEGYPRPEALWYKDGTQLKGDKRIVISDEGKVYKLELFNAVMDDAGIYKCVIKNRLGEKSQETPLKLISVNEYRKPIMKQELEPIIIKKNESGTIKLTLTADPIPPTVIWTHDGKEISAEDGVYEMSFESEDIENGLKLCTYSLTLPKAQHKQTGEYKFYAKNKYGDGETSTRLDVYLVPEIDGLKDTTVIPYETIQFEVLILSNPKPKVTWTQGDVETKNCEHTQLIADIEAEIYRLVITNIGLGDDGVFTVTASNSQGESKQSCVLHVHTEVPSFALAIQDQTIKAYHDVDFRVRVNGVPKPHIKWFKEGKELQTEGRVTVENDEEHQVSGLMIEKLAEGDVGVYSVTASNLVGQAECSAQLAMAQIPPGFPHPPERYIEVDEGETLEIKTKLDGSPIPTVKWYRDGEELLADDHVKLKALPDGTVELLIESVKPTDCGAYKLVATNRNGERACISAVAVKPNNRAPVFVKPLGDVMGKAGELLKLEAQIMAFPAPEIHWFKDGHPMRPSQNVNFVNSPGGVIGIHFERVTPEDAGKYSLTISNRLGDLAASAVVEVEAADRKPVFQSALQPTKVVDGYPAKLQIKVYGHPKPKLSWSFRGQDIIPDGKRYSEVTAPDGTVSLLINKCAPEDAGEYAVTASNDLGSCSCKAKLEVTGKDKDAPEEPPTFVHPLRDTNTEEGSAIVLDAPFLGNPIPDVEWSKDGEPIFAGKRTTLTCDGRRVGLEIRPAELADAGRYQCTLTNRLGSNNSSANVGVRKVYQAPKFTQGFSDLQQLPGYDAKFMVRVNGLPTPDVTWTKSGRSAAIPGRDTDKFQIKRDGDACVLYIRDCTADDAGNYTCTARNQAGEATMSAALEVVDQIGKKQKAEAPVFLKRLGDCEVYQGMTARFTACVSGFPEPEVEWYRDNVRIYPSERVHFEREGSGLLRLIIEKVGETDVAKYKLRVSNEYGEDECDADLTYDSLEERPRRTMSDQYQDYDSLRKSGAPMPLADRPIVSRMTDRHLTLSWKPSIPKGPREPVTYRVEMCELPGGDWNTIRTGIRSCACDIRNLIPFRDYKFRVRVENKYGVSDPSPYAITNREKLEPEPPKFIPYLEPDIDFRPETSPFFPKDFDIEKPPHDGFAQAPRFLGEGLDYQYGVKNHNCQLTWFVYGYPKPKMTFYFGDELIEMGGRYDHSYTRNGQATLFINKMLERDVGMYEACATNEHGEARRRVFLNVGEFPRFISRPEETIILARKSGQLEARLHGVPFPDIKWYKDWLPLAASSRIKMHFHEPDTAVLIISDAMVRDAGLYSISARNVVGSASCSVSIRIEESESEFSYATYSGRMGMREHKPNKNRFLEEFYDLGDELGRGTAGVAYHAVERLTGRNYAAKVMHGKHDLKPFMLNELEIYNQLNHRKLLRLQDVFETTRSLTLITELAGGGELLDVLTREEYITESLIAGYIRQLLLGLDHLHSQNIAHLGLTPGDLLISHPGGDDLKICDFGLSRKIFWGKLASLNYGMPEFVAPEVANGDGVHMAADMWSVGVITLLFLTGESAFRGKHDRETLSRVRAGKWNDSLLSNLSEDCRDFIKLLLVYQAEGRMDVKTALKHPWLGHADKMPADETRISTGTLREYYRQLREWYSNASCRTWYRRKPLENADTHPSCMVYPPGWTYTPPPTPKRMSPEPGTWENKIPSRDNVDYELGTFNSESHYQYGPDTYLLQLRDVDFPCRIREYMKVALRRSPGFALNDTRDWRAPIIRERRRFTDVMDEEIDDERKDRISRYGSADTYTLRRLRRELGTRLDGQVEAEAIVESKRDGQPPFLREKPQLLPIVEEQNAQLSCLAVGDPKPIVQWFKNDNLVTEGRRVKVIEAEDGRSILSFQPAMITDAGIYKVVARNRIGQTVARTRVVLASPPSAPDSPEATEVSDTEVLLRWKQPKDDGNSTVVCYSLQYKEADTVDWKELADNIDHEFFLVRNLQSNTDHHFRLSARNRIGWSEKGIPSQLVRTKEAGAAKVTGCTRAMMHLQQLTESGQPVAALTEQETPPPADYTVENTPLTWKEENPQEKFNFISEISRGRFSLVAKAIEKATDRVVMVKVLSWNSQSEIDVLREFEAWRSLRHERVCTLVEAYKFSGAATFILEKLQGSDVLTYLASRHEYSEQVVCSIITQVLDGLQYLHWRGLCHLAIEPDNVVMAGVRSAQVKLVDFGAAQRVSKLGTGVPPSVATEFSAPEVLLGEPAFPQSDVWSVGVLTYILLSGVSPFRAATVDETRQNITFVRYRFEFLFKELTAEATRFIMLLFKRTPSKRPTAEECHEHRWLLPTEHVIKRRERAIFLGNRLKDFSEQYHNEKARAAAAAEEQRPSSIPVASKLSRSISVQEELLTPC